MRAGPQFYRLSGFWVIGVQSVGNGHCRIRSYLHDINRSESCAEIPRVVARQRSVEGRLTLPVFRHGAAIAVAQYRRGAPSDLCRIEQIPDAHSKPAEIAHVDLPDSGIEVVAVGFQPLGSRHRFRLIPRLAR